MTADIYIVLVEDRHADVDARPFTTQEAAIAKAEELLAIYTRHHPEDVDRELNDSMIGDGWVFNATYGPEGDAISVIRRELHGLSKWGLS